MIAPNLFEFFYAKPNVVPLFFFRRVPSGLSNLKFKAPVQIGRERKGVGAQLHKLQRATVKFVMRRILA